MAWRGYWKYGFCLNTMQRLRIGLDTNWEQFSGRAHDFAPVKCERGYGRRLTTKLAYGSRDTRVQALPVRLTGSYVLNWARPERAAETHHDFD